jgi:hypothetical protein
LTTSNWFWFISAAVFVAGSESASAQGCATPPKGLSAWYTFDEPVFAKAKKTPGKAGNALRFDGATDFVELPANPGLQVGEGDFTVEAWIRTSDGKTIRNIFDHRSFRVQGYLLFLRRGNPGFQVGSGGIQFADTIAANVNVADGKWHHVAAVVKRLPLQASAIYVDGVPTGATGKPVGVANLDHDEPVWLGRHRRHELINRDNMYYNGDLDELTVYRRALAPAEIKAIFAAGSQGKCKKRP